MPGDRNEDTRVLAVKLRDGDAGTLAHEDAPGNVLHRGTAADLGVLPLWGQLGMFDIGAASMAVHIQTDGMFGTSGGWGF